MFFQQLRIWTNVDSPKNIEYWEPNLHQTHPFQLMKPQSNRDIDDIKNRSITTLTFDVPR